MIGDPLKLNWVMVADNIGTGARVGCMMMQVPLNKVAHTAVRGQQGMVHRLNRFF